MPEPQTESHLKSAPAGMDRLNERLAKAIEAAAQRLFQTEKFRATKEAVLAIEGLVFFSLGTTLMQIGEWFFAVCTFVLLGLLLFAKGLTLNRWAKRALSCAGSILLSALLVAITVLHKPESESWSNLEKLNRRTLSHSSKRSQSADLGKAQTYAPSAENSSPPKPPEPGVDSNGLRRNRNADTLISTTNELAREIVDFTDQREGNTAKQASKQFAAAMNSVLAGTNEAQNFQRNLVVWNSQTLKEFDSQYWPRVQDVMEQLANEGVDTSPATRAVASLQNRGPRGIGLQLSVLATRVGKKPPFQRVMTPLEGQSLVRVIGWNKIKVYAYIRDQNSEQIAKEIRAALIKGKRDVDRTIYPLQPKPLMPEGIFVLLPGLTLSDPVTPVLQAAELEGTVGVDPHRTPEGGVTKIEVWPCDSTCAQRFVAQHEGMP